MGIADAQTKSDGPSHDLTEKIIGVFYQVHNELGFGFLEAVYKESMRIALLQPGLMVEAEVGMPVYFRGLLAGIFRAGLVVEKDYSGVESCGSHLEISRSPASPLP